VFNAKAIKKDFPILSRKIGGEELVYLDNGATTQKPKKVIDSLVSYYENNNANVHRGVHTLSEEATNMYEHARKQVADFINALPSEIIFTSGTTESLNIVAYAWAEKNIKKGDVILATISEHHSNFIPWQMCAKRVGAVLELVNITEDGLLDMADLKSKLNSNVKLIAISHASNVLGTIFPIKEICKLAKQHDIKVSVDGAQGIPHLKVDVKSLGCDFYSFSGHKMLGPTGIGVLFIKKDILETLEPYKYGGGMIEKVSVDESSWTIAPERFEAGTPNVADAIGLGSAIEYLESIGLDVIRNHEIDLIEHALPKLSGISGLKIMGPLNSKDRSGLIAFSIEGLHGHDVAAVLNTKGIAVRSGHHCTMPLHKKMNIAASIRASFYIYNSTEDIDTLVDGIEYAINILRS